MELNALDFVNKYKDLLIDGVVVDPVLDKAQSLFLNKMVVHMTDTIGFGGCAHSFSLFGPSDVFKKTLTLFSLIGEEVYIERGVLPLISDIIGADESQCIEEIFYGIYLLTVSQDTSLRRLYDGEEGIHIPDALPSFLQERQNDREGFVGNFNYAWDYLAEKYSHSIKTRLNISETFKEKESIRLFSLEPKPLHELAVVPPSDYGKDDLQEVKTYTYCLDEFMGRSYG